MRSPQVVSLHHLELGSPCSTSWGSQVRALYRPLPETRWPPLPAGVFILIGERSAPFVPDTSFSFSRPGPSFFPMASGHLYAFVALCALSALLVCAMCALRYDFGAFATAFRARQRTQLPPCRHGRAFWVLCRNGGRRSSLHPSSFSLRPSSFGRATRVTGARPAARAANARVSSCSPKGVPFCSILGLAFLRLALTVHGYLRYFDRMTVCYFAILCNPLSRGYRGRRRTSPHRTTE